MPKLKTHKGAKKRFHITGTGKILRMKGHRSHFRRRKSEAARGAYDAKLPVHSTLLKRVRRALPYGA